MWRERLLSILLLPLITDLELFKKYPCLGPNPRYSDLISLEVGLGKSILRVLQ